MSCDEKPFFKPTALSVKNSPVNRLVGVADRLRNLTAQLGLRQYTVKVIRTAWTSGIRGRGQEAVTSIVDILPVPRVAGVGNLSELMQQIGLDEEGDLVLYGISGTYDENTLSGVGPDGNEPGPGESVFWEIEYIATNASEPQKRRFTLSGVPEYQPGKLQWVVRLKRQRQDRSRNGDPN